MKNVVVIGVGLIGGSFALNLKKLFGGVIISGIDNNATHLSTALNLGLIDKKGNFKDLKKANLVVLAVPVDSILKLLPLILDKVSSNTIVMDMGSTKSEICKVIENHPKRHQFLPNHPIAGNEFSGPDSAHLSLFQDKVNIICDVEKTKSDFSNTVVKILTDIGMKIRFMDSNDHDFQIAYVSHLSHISSFMLGKTVIDKEKNEFNIFDMAGSGFESTVRLAKSSPDMWAPIFKQNKLNVIESLDGYIQNLNQFKNMLETNDFRGIKEVMESTNHIKEILKDIS